MIRAALESLRPLWREACVFYYERALEQVDKLHPDVPFIVTRINELKAERLSAEYRRKA